MSTMEEGNVFGTLDLELKSFVDYLFVRVWFSTSCLYRKIRKGRFLYSKKEDKKFSICSEQRIFVNPYIPPYNRQERSGIQIRSLG